MKELYLSSDEYKDFAVLRKVIKYHKIIIENRNIIIIEVDKPLIGQKYGWGSKNITEFYLTNRFMNDRDLVEKIDKFPIHVDVLIPKNFENQNPNSLSQLKNIAWACLYDNEEDAINYRIR